MLEILNELNGHPGVEGCLVVTPDGMVVAAAFGNGLDEETTAALVSGLVAELARLLKIATSAPLERLVLTATRGKIVIENLANAYLVTVTNQFINLDHTLLEIRSAAKRLMKLARITV
jgi:predicted regulator of Ras-like GTPase activity (Roadblock/LC7/MglB family)